MKKASAALIGLMLGGLLLAASTCAATPAPVPAAPAVPAKYQPLYQELDAALARAEEFLKAHPADSKTTTTFSVELLVASGQRGEELLLPRTWSGVVLTMMRLKELGATGVVVVIPYPMLLDEFPRAKELRDFERRLAGQVRSSGLKLTVKMGAFFPQKEFSRQGQNYSGLTYEKFTAGLAQMGGWIAREVKPDNLVILSEPDTISRLTGVPLPPQAFRDLVNRVLPAVRQPGIKIGAGTGTWSPLTYFELLARETQVDLLDLHVYPVQPRFFADRLPQIAALARANRKGLSMSEAWLYKLGESQLGSDIAGAPDAFARDAWSFWTPLDERFIRAITGYARLYKMEFCSFFWMRNLYGYLDYTPDLDRQPPGSLMQQVNKVAAANILAGKPSAAGETFRESVR